MLINAETAKIAVKEFKNRPDTKVKKRVNNLLNKSNDKIFIAAENGKTCIKYKAMIFNPQVIDLFEIELERLDFYVKVQPLGFHFYSFIISWNK